MFHSALVTALILSKFKKPGDNALRHTVGFLECLYRARSWIQILMDPFQLGVFCDSVPACKPRHPGLQRKLLLMLPLCPLSLPRSFHLFFLLPANSCTSQTVLSVTVGLLELKG